MVLAKFEENLIEISKGETWEEASKEWGFLYKKEKDNKDNHCLCGHKLKHQYYYYNNFTKKIICCGMECKKHIDDHRGNKQYDNNFISDLNSVGGEYVGDYDLEEWCSDNEQRLWDRFFWRINALVTEEQLIKYAEYLNEMWFELVDLDVILDKIDEKLQEIIDRKEAFHERVRQEEERVRQQKEKEQLEQLELLKKIKTEERVRKEKDKEQLEVYKKELRLKENNYRIKEKELKLMLDENIKLNRKINSLRESLRNKNCCSALFKCDCNN